jgi:hypothetical protein
MLFRNNPQAGLKKAQAALSAGNTKIVELEAARTVALAETDELKSVHDIDTAIADQRKAAATLTDRIQVLAHAAREQQAAEHRKQYAAALAVVRKTVGSASRARRQS